MKRLFSILGIISVLIAEPWHSDITHRPRTVLLANEVEATQNRLSQAPFNFLWYNNYGTYTSIIPMQEKR